MVSSATPASALSFSAEINGSFTPDTIVAGANSRLDINLYNPNFFQLDNASFTDNLIGVQAGLRLANPVNMSNSCGGVVIAEPGATKVILSGGTVPAQVGTTRGSCTISVYVTSSVGGSLRNSIPAYGALPPYDYGGVGLHATARGGLDTITNSNSASPSLTVIGLQPPSVSKNFSPSTVWVGQSSQLEINI